MTGPGRHSFERLHEAKRENYLGLGPLYRETIIPGVQLLHVFSPADIAEVFRADGKYPLRPPIPILMTANKRDGLPLGMGSM